jgi:hypothetical protein
MQRYLQYLPTGGVKSIGIKQDGKKQIVSIWLRIPVKDDWFSYFYESGNWLPVHGTLLLSPPLDYAVYVESNEI